MRKRLTIIITLGAVAGIFIVLLHPVNATVYKLFLLGCMAIAWTGFAMLTWKQRCLKWLVLAAPVIFALPFLLPGKEIETTNLREDYVRRLQAFEATEYLWGGESPRGIDCSGLPRRALRDALLSYGIKYLNGRASRAFLEQWWFDTSAKAMGEGYRDFTTPAGIEGTVKSIPYEKLQPGDLAVTDTGVHVLAYVGGKKWIQAEPGIGAVITLNGRPDENLWFKSPVTIHRWRILSDK